MSRHLRTRHKLFRGRWRFLRTWMIIMSLATLFITKSKLDTTHTLTLFRTASGNHTALAWFQSQKQLTNRVGRLMNPSKRSLETSHRVANIAHGRVIMKPRIASLQEWVSFQNIIVASNLKMQAANLLLFMGRIMFNNRHRQRILRKKARRCQSLA